MSTTNKKLKNLQRKVSQLWVVTPDEYREESERTERAQQPGKVLGEVLFKKCLEGLSKCGQDHTHTLVVGMRVSGFTAAGGITHANKLLEEADVIHWKLREHWTRSDLTPRKRTFFSGSPIGLEDLVGTAEPMVEDWEWTNTYSGTHKVRTQAEPDFPLTHKQGFNPSFAKASKGGYQKPWKK